MAKKNKVGAEYVILERISEEAYPVPFSEWNKLKKIASEAKCPSRLWGFLGAISIGVLASSFLQYIINCIQNKGLKFDDAYLYISIVFFIISILLLLLDNGQSKSLENIGKQIISEMEDIEHKYQSTTSTEYPPVEEEQHSPRIKKSWFVFKA